MTYGEARLKQVREALSFRVDDYGVRIDRPPSHAASLALAALDGCVLLTAEEAENVDAVIGDCTNGAREARERARALLTPERAGKADTTRRLEMTQEATTTRGIGAAVDVLYDYAEREGIAPCTQSITVEEGGSFGTLVTFYGCRYAGLDEPGVAEDAQLRIAVRDGEVLYENALERHWNGDGMSEWMPL